MTYRQSKLIIALLGVSAVVVIFFAPKTIATSSDNSINEQLYAALRLHGFTGRVGLSPEQRLGRKIDNQLADLGRLAFHDSLLGLNDDNSCAGCHAASRGFGDSQSIAIGIENNNIVGPDRTGPRNQRRAPIVLNNVFYPALMWNSRFAANSTSARDKTRCSGQLAHAFGCEVRFYPVRLCYCSRFQSR